MILMLSIGLQKSIELESHYAVRFVLLGSLLLSGCATRYVERDPGKGELADYVGDVVVSQASESIKTDPPRCIAVLPLAAGKPAIAPTDSVRKAIHSHLAPTGVRLIPLQKVDSLIDSQRSVGENAALISASSGCEAVISGEVTEKSTRFWGVYSEVRIGAKLQIFRVGIDKPIWEGRHTAVVRDGGVPLNPISVVSSAVSAASNLREEQITRTTHDLARRLVFAIPGLRYNEESGIQLAQKIPQASEPPAIEPLARLKSEIEALSAGEAELALVRELNGPRWTNHKDREVLADMLVTKAPANPIGYAEMARAKLVAGQGGMAVVYAKKLVELSPLDPEHQFLLGRAYLRANKPAESLQPLLKAAGADIPKPVYFSGLGIAYSQQGQYLIAVAAYQKSLALDPVNSYTQLQMGIAQALAGDEKEAAVTIRQSIITAIANNEKTNAETGLNALASLGLESRLNQVELKLIQEKVGKL
jgi:Flp pilus assembly protein TadD